jgi:hypothetical protein
MPVVTGLPTIRNMRPTPLFGRRAAASARRGSLARRLFLVLTMMLLALVAVAGARLVTSRATANALEEFRADTVGESERIADVRAVLEKADDAGEAHVETGDPSEDEIFAAIGRQIDRGMPRTSRSSFARPLRLPRIGT